MELIATLGDVSGDISVREILAWSIGGAGMICAFITIWVWQGVRHSIAITKSREESRREMAAYVAEGNMKPDDAERIMRADMSKWEQLVGRN